MIKSFLLLMLVTTQLLLGSGASIHLCLNGDGQICCLDGGAGACDCREEDAVHNHQPPSDACESACCGVQPQAPPCDNHSSAVELGCDCTHVPIALSREEPAIAERTQLARDFLVVDVADVCSIAFASLPNDLFATPPPAVADQLAIPSQALRIISTVVIRC